MVPAGFVPLKNGKSPPRAKAGAALN